MLRFYWRYTVFFFMKEKILQGLVGSRMVCGLLRFLRQHATLDACSKPLGGKAILSKFGLIKKLKNGKWKKRIILDLKETTPVSIMVSTQL